jgi:hypothetical protein
MYRVGDEVIVMSSPGRFTIVAVDGNVLTIENEQGVSKQVLVQAVRKMEKKSSPVTEP